MNMRVIAGFSAAFQVVKVVEEHTSITTLQRPVAVMAIRKAPTRQTANVAVRYTGRDRTEPDRPLDIVFPDHRISTMEASHICEQHF